MKEIGKTLTKILFYFVAAVLLVWTASLTVHFIASALPSMPWYVPYLALVVFDGGMIAWMFVFLKYAEGTIQRAVALGLVMFDFAGVALLVMADILLGGQTWTAAPEGLGTWAVWGIGIWTVVNVLGVLAFHIGDPQAQIQMSIQNEKDQIFRGALDNLGARRAENSKMLSNELGSRMYTQMLDELLVDNDRNGVPDALEGSYQVPAQAGIPAQPVTTYVNGTVATHTAAQTRPAPATLDPDAKSNSRSSTGNGSNFPLR